MQKPCYLGMILFITCLDCKHSVLPGTCCVSCRMLPTGKQWISLFCCILVNVGALRSMSLLYKKKIIIKNSNNGKTNFLKSSEMTSSNQCFKMN